MATSDASTVAAYQQIIPLEQEVLDEYSRLLANLNMVRFLYSLLSIFSYFADTIIASHANE